MSVEARADGFKYATTPLTDNEAWTEIAPGSLWLFRDGEPVRKAATVPGPPKKQAAPAA